MPTTATTTTTAIAITVNAWFPICTFQTGNCTQLWRKFTEHRTATENSAPRNKNRNNHTPRTTSQNVKLNKTKEMFYALFAHTKWNEIIFFFFLLLANNFVFLPLSFRCLFIFHLYRSILQSYFIFFRLRRENGTYKLKNSLVTRCRYNTLLKLNATLISCWPVRENERKFESMRWECSRRRKWHRREWK